MRISEEIRKDRLEIHRVVNSIIAEVSKKQYSASSGLEEIRSYIADITFDPQIIDEFIKPEIKPLGLY